MSSMTVRRGVATGLGAAAGALAIAAFVSSAPIASADDTDFALPAPAAPSDEYTSVFTIGEGGTEHTYETTWDGTGLPTTTDHITTLPTGEEAFGFSDESQSLYTLGGTSYESVFESTLIELTSPTGNELEFVSPVLELFSPAI